MRLISAKTTSSSPSLARTWKGEALYGTAPVFAAIKCRRFWREIYKLCVQEGIQLAKRKDYKLIRDGMEEVRRNRIAIEYHSKHDLNMVVPGQVHQGFLLDCSSLDIEEIESMPPSAQPLKSRQSVWLALDEVYDPHNLGAMIRTAAFLGAEGIVVSRKNSAPLSPTVSKVSSGAMEAFPLCSCSQLPKLLRSARQSKWTVIGSAVSPDSVNFREYNPSGPTILVMGNEANGLRQTVKMECDVFIQIKATGMDNRLLDSLNVSVAAGILMGQLIKS